MKITAWALLTLAFLVTLSLGKSYSIDIKKFLLSYKKKIADAYDDDDAITTKKCDTTITITNYNPPYLFMTVEGENIEYKTAIVNGKSSEKFTWKDDGNNKKDKGRYEFSNTYNPVKKVKATVYSDKEKKDSKKTKTCELKIINNWVCSSYVNPACTVTVPTKELYAEENNKPVPVAYIIESTLNEKYSACDCKQWNIDVSGTAHTLGCSSKPFEKHAIEKSIELAPNNANNKEYTLTGSLTTSHKIANGAYDTIKCSGTNKIYINNPPKAPTPTYPTNNITVYYSKSAECYNKEFTWSEPGDWGWIHGKKTVPKIYTIEISGGSDASIQDDLNSVTFYNPPCLTEGQHAWTISANPDQRPVSAKEQLFYVCAVNKIGAMTLKSPANGEYVGKTVTLSWDKPDKNTDCALESVYNYSITVKSDAGTEIYTKQFPETELVLGNLEEGTYQWKVETVGPAGESSSSGERKFYVCVQRAPSSPRSLGIVDEEENPIVCYGESGDYKLAFSWGESADKGEQCTANPQKIKYRVELHNSSGKVYEDNDATSGGKIMLPCVTSDYKVLVYANNGYSDSDPATHDFSICSRRKPDAPKVRSSSEMNHCRSTTEISWSHNSWGSSCNESKSKLFKITCTMGGKKESYIVVPTTLEASSYTYNATLDEGTWDVSIVACTLDGDLCSDPGTGTVTASAIPEAASPDVTNDGHNIVFSWATDSNFMSCANQGDFKYTLEYEVDGAKTSVSGMSVEESVSHTISIDYGTIEWRVILSSPYDEGTTTEMEPYSASSDCVIVEPKWAKLDKALNSPEEGSFVIEDVTFKWTKVHNFGVACKENKSEETGVIYNYIKDDYAAKYYLVNANGVIYSVSSDTTSVKGDLSAYGEYTWNVTAYNGNVSSSTPTRTFCRANSLPEFTVNCPQGPYIENKLNWTITRGFGETCKRDYGFVVKHNGETITKTTSNYFEVSEKYFGETFTWSVESYIGDKLSSAQSCTTELCKIIPPSSPVLEGGSIIEVTDKHGNWTFAWTDNNKYIEMCGMKTSFTYEVNVTVDGTINTFITDANSTELKFNKTGKYHLSVRTHDGISYSEPESVTLDLCIPGQIEKPILTSPQNGEIILSDKAYSLEWEKLFPSDTQCGKGANYTLRYWAGDEPPTEKDIETLSDFPLGILKTDTTYSWNITIESDYWNAASDTYNFTVCTPSTPKKPVLGSYKELYSSQFTLYWDGVDFGERCQLQDSTGYNVYLYENVGSNENVRSAYVTYPNYTFYELTDGKYQVRVEAVNYKYKSEKSEPMNLSVCVITKPGKPTLWYPRFGDVVRVRNGVRFEVVPQINKGSKCIVEKNGLDNGSAPGRYQLHVDNKFVGSFNETELDPTESLSKYIYRLSEIKGLGHGAIFWNVTYTNSDGMNETSSEYFFIGCDRPQQTRNMVPPDNETFEQFNVEFSWDVDEVDFGYKCTTDSDVKAEQTVILYLEKVNITEVMADQDVTDPEDIDYSLLAPATSVASIPFGDLQKYKFEDAELGATYVWRTETFNGYDSASSDTYMFKIADDYCQIVTCEHGSCSNEMRMCICDEGYSGDTCSHQVPKSKGNSVLGPALGGSLGGIVLIAIIVALILFILLRKSGRKRVVLEGPGGDIRFSRVKVPAAARDAPEDETAAIEQRVREDCERLQNGATPAEAFVFAQEYRAKIKSDGIDDTTKAILYTYYMFGCGRDLLKFFISAEVNKALRPETLFRQTSPATAMFKYWSKVIGLDYLFACFSDVLKGLLQHEVDATNDRKSDVSMQLFNDTCEVDPTRIEDDEDVDQLLAVNALQLSLTVQRFATQIYRSVNKIPYEIKDICTHIYTAVESAYPGHGVRGVSAFLFLRFYSVSISVPEAYGLLKNPPSEELRRTLVLVTKVLQVMSLGNKFGDKEEFMKQFNSLVDENRDKMDAFYKGLLDKDKPCDGIKPDAKVPSGISKDSLLLMAFLMNGGKKADKPAPAESAPEPTSPQ